MARPVGKTGGEDEAMARHAACGGGGPQGLERSIAGALGEPERGGRDLAQDRAPEVERGRVDLERVVEGAEHGPVRRQAAGFP